MTFNWQAEYRRLREKEQQALLVRKREIYARSPALRDWEERYLALQSKLGRARMRDDAGAANELGAALREMQGEKEALLIAGGHAPDALDLHVRCARCNDYGVDGGRECACLQERRREFEAAQCGEAFREQCFENFRLDLFPEEGDQRRRMDKLRKIALDYANGFPQNAPRGLFLTGSAGLGKSFILHCIGGRVMQRGYRVRKVTGYQFHHMLMNELFAGHDDASYRELLAADLLLFDDLGSEPKTSRSISESYFFALLDARTLHNKPMAVATNYSLEEIDRIYGERCSSRLLDKRHFRAIALHGEDVRLRLAD